jgi:hypothetical protein
MAYAPFHERFPDIAEREIRNIVIFNDPELPADKYSLVESYCDDPECDCRRVFFNVFAWKAEQILAVIAYGWESEGFYANLADKHDARFIRNLRGPCLHEKSRQSPLAPALLKLVVHTLEDQHYLKRIKKHYKMFRQAVEQEARRKTKKRKSRSKKKPGRNDPCPCGSGQKYKKCCGK